MFASVFVGDLQRAPAAGANSLDGHTGGAVSSDGGEARNASWYAPELGAATIAGQWHAACIANVVALIGASKVELAVLPELLGTAEDSHP